MISSLVKGFAEHPSPDTQRLQSSVCSASSTIFALNKNSISYARISDKDSVKLLPLKRSLDSQFTNILCTNKGEMLVLTSQDKVATISIPPQWFSNGILTPVDGVSLDFCVVYTSPKPFIKVDFHPYHQFSLTALTSDKLSLINLGSQNSQTNCKHFEMHNTVSSFTSFSYGTDFEWLRFTIFLTTDRGDIFYICPVIPVDALIPIDVVKELWIWFHQQFSHIPKTSELYRVNYSFLCESFGTYEELIALAAKNSKHIRVGSSQISVSQFSSAPLSLNNYKPSLQGPISFPTLHKKICDITVPASYYSSTGPVSSPALSLVYETGTAQILLFDFKDENSWLLSPSWRDNLTNELSLSKAIPVLIQCDKINLSASQDESRFWKLQADPFYPWYFYAFDTSSGRSLSLFSGFLYNSLKMDDSEYDLDCMKKSQCTPILQSDKEISGTSVLFDPFSGHLIALRLQPSDIVFHNLALHNSLSAYQQKLHEANGQEVSLFQNEFDAIFAESNVRWQPLQDLFKKIKEGLLYKPDLEVIVESESTPVTSLKPENGKEHLVRVASHLEAKVVAPLQDVAEHNKFHLSIVKKLYSMQLSIIEGNPQAPIADPESDSLNLSMGLKKILSILSQKNKKLQASLDSIQQSQQNLKALAEAALVLSVNTKQLSSAEKKYYEELQTMTAKVNKMNEKIDAIKKITTDLSAASRFSHEPTKRFSPHLKLTPARPNLTLSQEHLRVLPAAQQPLNISDDDLASYTEIFDGMSKIFEDSKEKVLHMQAQVIARREA